MNGSCACDQDIHRGHPMGGRADSAPKCRTCQKAGRTHSEIAMMIGRQWIRAARRIVTPQSLARGGARKGARGADRRRRAHPRFGERLKTRHCAAAAMASGRRYQALIISPTIHRSRSRRSSARASPSRWGSVHSDQHRGKEGEMLCGIGLLDAGAQGPCARRA